MRHLRGGARLSSPVGRRSKCARLGYPSEATEWISFSGNKPVVTDGPFSEARAVVGGYYIIEVESKEEAIQWADLARSQEENDAEEEGWRNRNQVLRTACWARYGVSSDATGCRDALSEDGPDRAISHGPNCRDRAGAQRSTGIHFTRCRGPGSRTSWLRNRGPRQERLGVHGRTRMDGHVRPPRILEPKNSRRRLPQPTRRPLRPAVCLQAHGIVAGRPFQTRSHSRNQSSDSQKRITSPGAGNYRLHDVQVLLPDRQRPP